MTFLAELQKWQTLMTGIIALIAAGIAYRGATAKVRLDREVLQSENRRRRLSLYLKVEMSFRQLSEAAQEVRTQIGHRGGFEETWVLKSSDFRIEEPPELEEAWTYLDLLPRPIIAEVRSVRDCLRRLAGLAAYLGDNGVMCEPDKEPHYIVQEARTLVTTLWQSSAIVAASLEPLIKEMAPEMDEDERMAKTFGNSA
jgi:hypothetical protein